MCVVKSMEVFLQHCDLRGEKIPCFITVNYITLILGIFKPLKAFSTNLQFNRHELDSHFCVSQCKHSLFRVGLRVCETLVRDLGPLLLYTYFILQLSIFNKCSIHTQTRPKPVLPLNNTLPDC